MPDVDQIQASQASLPKIALAVSRSELLCLCLLPPAVTLFSMLLAPSVGIMSIAASQALVCAWIVRRLIRQTPRSSSGTLALDSAYLELLATTTHGVWILNSRASTEYVNANLAQLLGYPLDAMFGRSVTDFLEQGEGLSQSELIHRLTALHPAGIELKLRCQDGTLVTVRVDTRTLRDERGHDVGIIQTFQRIAADQRQDVAVFAGGVVHEINSPLTIIAGKARQLKKMASGGEIDPPRISQTADDISRTVMRISRIVKGLRAFASGSDSDPYAQVSVRALISETLEFASERFGDDTVKLEVAPIPEDLMLECRATQISQLVLNLLNNAHDAVQPLPERWVKLEVGVEAGWVELSITDSGSGIPEELRAKIMQPFFTTKEPGKGTGLGLNICSGIAFSHHGALTIDAQCPHTRFVLRIPQIQAAPEAEARPSQQAA